jgi:VanZ family protein
LSAALARAPVPLALMAAIFYFSAQPDPGVDAGDAGQILAHAGEYLLLTVLWAWALAPALGRRALIAAAAISLGYAISDEVHQSYVEGRDSDPLDVLADAAGIAIGALLVSRLRTRAGRRRSRTSPRSDPRPS